VIDRNNEIAVFSIALTAIEVTNAVDRDLRTLLTVSDLPTTTDKTFKRMTSAP
jgi:hypothetical protein